MIALFFENRYCESTGEYLEVLKSKYWVYGFGQGVQALAGMVGAFHQIFRFFYFYIDRVY